MHRIRSAVLFVALILLAQAPLSAQEIPWEFQGVSRIVAIGDVHGAYDRFVESLKATGLVDKKLAWVGGTAHLVQTGDVVDRGPDSRKVMDLLMALEPEAQAAGGRVHALIGNHEFWNVVGELGYVHPKEYAAFDGDRDKALRAERDPTALPGVFAHREAFSASGTYGRWIRGHNAVVKLNGVVFVHGGITPDVAALGIAEVNRRVRADLDAPGATWRQGLAWSDDGPLMSRRYSDEDLSIEEETERAPEVQLVLEKLEATTVVMGHTVTYGLITPRFGRRAILIDTGMLEVYLGGRQAALVLEGGRAFAQYAKGKMEIPESLSGDAGNRYVEAVVVASPNDMALRQKLASVRVRQGRNKEAAELYFKLGVLERETLLPYLWRREAAECFKALGEGARAQRASLLYLDALGTYAQRAGPGSVPLHHTYVRECLRLGLLKEEALAAARRVSSAYPNNATYRITLGWAYLDQGDPSRAAQILTAAIREGGDGFDAQFQLGRAQERLNEPVKALEAFRAALAFKPGSRDAEEAIAKLGAAAVK